MIGHESRLADLCINTIRTLAMDAVEKASSGHPGSPMGQAAMAYVLWTRFLRHNPRNPGWRNRDRFVLSAGHGSMLLYSLLFLTGYDLSLDEIKRFRQWESRTPGHPEHDVTPGVETTTGPLGQGFGNGVGMAIAERHLAARYNRPGYPLVDYRIYAICSDGDLMEGVASEAASLAGHLRLSNLIYFYDDNRITIDGSTSLAFSEDVGRRFDAYGWFVQEIDGMDVDAVDAAIRAAQQQGERPSLIRAHTHIGYGSALQDNAKAHGQALGKDVVAATKKFYGWPADDFFVPEDALAFYRQAIDRGARWEQEWHALKARYAVECPERAAEFDSLSAPDLPAGWDSGLPVFEPSGGDLATRIASGKTLNAIAARVPSLIGGAADLATSNETDLKGFGDFEAGSYAGRNLHFGVREHAMGAVLNGIALSGQLRPFGGTFLIFSDYMRPAVRLASFMGVPVIYVYTHDSVGLGEDGPTHQPVEHLASLRAMPNLRVIRPGDANETVVAWKVALRRRDGPTALALTRQKLPVLDRRLFASAEGLTTGGYILADAVGGPPDLILIATGSELSLIVQARPALEGLGIRTRLVSLPCWELFDEQPREYRDEVLLPSVGARLAVEAGATLGWCRYVGDAGAVIGLDRFGASAPYEAIMRHFGFTADHVIERARALVGR